MTDTYYSVLGVSETASAAEIKAAYRSLAVQFHPDKNNGATAAVRKLAEEKFKEIQESYEVLTDAGKKLTYDQQLAALRQSRQPKPRPSAWSNQGKDSTQQQKQTAGSQQPAQPISPQYATKEFWTKWILISAGLWIFFLLALIVDHSPLRADDLWLSTFWTGVSIGAFFYYLRRWHCPTCKKQVKQTKFACNQCGHAVLGRPTVFNFRDGQQECIQCGRSRWTRQCPTCGTKLDKVWLWIDRLHQKPRQAVWNFAVNYQATTGLTALSAIILIVALNEHSGQTQTTQTAPQAARAITPVGPGGYKCADGNIHPEPCKDPFGEKQDQKDAVKHIPAVTPDNKVQPIPPAHSPSGQEMIDMSEERGARGDVENAQHQAETAKPIIDGAPVLAILRNGYSVHHFRREVIGPLTRLYTALDGSSYVDVATDQIEHFEKAFQVPKPPVEDGSNTKEGPWEKYQISAPVKTSIHSGRFGNAKGQYAAIYPRCYFLTHWEYRCSDSIARLRDGDHVQILSPLTRAENGEDIYKVRFLSWEGWMNSKTIELENENDK